ncbi:asparagine--tRNA ligase [Candidatus Haliotispira prima]|uniref:Asparagine--tRNA ligase n=1 Tax=Candidatus Haliotispira prima TaxID=3034016 RepID=A0ABY8MHQ5_9SPIO|nr:asparagine--tRNA ligase [Candidatus Haliotispira prima]
MIFTMPATVKEILAAEAKGQEVELHAWVRSCRDSKNISFLNLNDGSCVSGIQVVVDEECRKASPAFAQTDQINGINQISNGASLRVKGRLVASQGNLQAVEIQASGIELLGAAPQDTYPLQKKRHSFEFLREISHLRGRSNSIGAVMRLRNRLSMLVHEFFQQHGFYYIHTPIITVSDAEGAGEMFRVESSGCLDEGRGGESLGEKSAEEKSTGKKRKYFFGQEAFLTVSGQMEGEVYAHSHGRVYTFGPTFRAEESNTSRHLAEFWMIEPEVAFLELDGLMDLAEALVRHLIGGTLRHCAEELELLNKWIEPELLRSLQSVTESEHFVRISYTEAIALLEGAVQGGKKFDYRVAWEDGLQTEHERWLTEEHFRQPVIVYNYPAEGKAFYMKQNEDGKTVRGMDVLVPRLGEIIGGSQREDDYEKLKARMLADGMDPEHYQWYLDLRRFGGTPHSGFGLGFERIVQYVTGMKNIRDVIPFPRAVGQAS